MKNLMKQFRTIKGERQADTATVLGVSREMYSMYESGKIKAPLSILVKVADHFDVSVDMIFGRNMQGLDFVKWMNIDQDMEMLKKFEQLPEKERKFILDEIDSIAEGGRICGEE